VSQADGEAVPVVPVTTRRRSTAEPDGRRAGTPGLESGYDEIVAEADRRYRARPDEAGRPVGGQTVEHAAAHGVHEATGAPGLRLVIGVDGDPRQWVRVANALTWDLADAAARYARQDIGDSEHQALMLTLDGLRAARTIPPQPR
jgi:hypothetical protein